MHDYVSIYNVQEICWPILYIPSTVCPLLDTEQSFTGENPEALFHGKGSWY